MAALSRTFPERLIEQSTPLSAIRRWNCSLVYWADSSGRGSATGVFVSRATIGQALQPGGLSNLGFFAVSR